jgi:hypothetical protein
MARLPYAGAILLGASLGGPWAYAQAQPLPGSKAVPGEANAPGADGAPAPAAVEVVVEGERNEPLGSSPTRRDLDLLDVQRLPGAFGDAFRAIEALPGVAPLASGMPHLFVRGANPSATGYFVDGIAVPFLYHLAIGPSVINPALIDDVVFYPGAYPAAYGRQVGGIVAASTRPPRRRLRLEAEVRLFDAGAYAEVPVFTERAQLFAAARYAYPGPMLSLVAPGTRLGYWDYQLGGSYQLSRRDRVGVLAFGSSDHLGQVDDRGVETELFGTRFHRVQAFLERRSPPAEGGDEGARARLALGYGRDDSALGEQGTLGSHDYVMRADAQVPLGPGARIGGGVDLAAEDVTFVPSPDLVPAPEPEGGEQVFEFDITKAFGSRINAAAGGYLELSVRPFAGLELVPGMRFDLYGEGHAVEPVWEPRGALRIHPASLLTLTTAAGAMHQRPSLLVAVPALAPRGLARGLQGATQLSQALDLALPLDIAATVTGFYHDYRDLTDLAATCGAGIEQCSVTDRAAGRAFGVEVALRRSLAERVGGLLSYTMSRSERRYRGETFLSDFDRTHVLHAALGVDLGRRWHVGGQLSVYDGRPHSLIAIDHPERPNEATLIGKRNALRRPPFVRLDLRAEKRWVVAERGWIGVVVELFNLTLQKETVDFDCRVSEVLGTQSGLTCGGQEVGPITIPSLGVSGGI